MSIFSFFLFFFYTSFFLYCMHSSKGRRRMKTSSRVFFLSLLYVRQRRVLHLDLAWSLLLSSLRRCVYIYIYFLFFFISIAALACALMVYRYVILCCCRSLSFFLFFDSIDARNGECSMLSLSLLLALLQSTLFVYSYVFLTLHLLVLFRCVPYVFFFEVTSKSKSSRHLYTGKRDCLFFWH